MGLPPETCHEMAVAGMVHDIGKLEIAKYLYSREPDPLTIEELKYVIKIFHYGICDPE